MYIVTVVYSFKEVVYLFKWLLYVQVASSEWLLGVHIQHFENVHGSVVINDLFCCCDDGSDSDVSLCKENITDLQMCKFVTNQCDNYILVYVRNCFYNNTCFVTKHNGQNKDIPFNQLVFLIPLEMESSVNVRK